jgi:hypothetical protein
MIYTIGTEVQEKNGRVRKKVDEGKWISRGRYVYMKANSEELSSDHRVFHKNGDKANDEPKNLVAIKFNGTRYGLLHSRVLYVPHGRIAYLKKYTKVKRSNHESEANKRISVVAQS